MFKGLHHASITTHDADRLSRFYQQHFGFEVVMTSQWNGDNPPADLIYGLRNTAVRMVMLRSRASFLEIFEFRRPEETRTDHRQVSMPGWTHIAMITDDIEADYKRLVDAGIPFNCPPQTAAGLCRATYGRDPDGNLVELLQPDPNGPFAQPVE